MRVELLLVVASAVKSSASWRDPDGFDDGSDLEHFITVLLSNLRMLFRKHADIDIATRFDGTDL